MFVQCLSLTLFICALLPGWGHGAVRDARMGDTVHMQQAAVRTLAENKQMTDDYGHLTSCLETPVPFKFDWKPRVLKTDETVVFYIDVLLNEQFLHGNVCASIWLDDVPDPIYTDCRDQKCEEFIKVVQKFIPDLKCPIPKGYELKRTYPFKLAPTIPLPSGKYRLRAEVWNESNKHILCVDGKVEVEDDY